MARVYIKGEQKETEKKQANQYDGFCSQPVSD